MLIQANHITLEYDTFGNSDQEPLLLISGLNTPMTRWSQSFCEKLAQCGYYVIRYNNRDTGRSERFNQYRASGILHLLAARFFGIKLKLPYTLQDMVQDSFALLDKLNIEKAHIVGRSMGGVIAQLCASELPERVLSLTVLMSTTGNIKLPAPSCTVIRLMLKRTPNPNKDLERYLQHRIKYTKAIGSRTYPISELEIRERILKDLASSDYNPGGGKRQLAALMQAGDIRMSIHKIKCPTQVIHGDCDPLVPLACGLDVHKNIAHSTMCIIKDMGHSLHENFIDELVSKIQLMKLKAL